MRNYKNKKLIFPALFFSIFLIGAGFEFSRAQVASQINVSAFVSNGKNESLKNGEYEIRFALYRTNRQTADAYPSDGDAGQRVWQETQKVYIRDGVLDAYLGAVAPLPAGLNFSSSEYYLGIRINNDSEFVPRKKLGSVPLAMDSAALQGATLGTAQGDIPLLVSGGRIDIKMLPTGSGSNQLVLGNDSRFSNISDIHLQNTDTGTSKLVFNVGSSNTIGGNNFDLTVGSAGNKPALRFNGNLNQWQYSNDGNIFTAMGATGNVDASQITTGILGVPNGGTGFGIYAVGDMLYANSTTSLAKLGIGADDQVLTIDSVTHLPTWTTVSGASPVNLLSAQHSDTTADTVVRGGLITGQGASASWSLLGPGTAGQILQSNGTDIGWISLTSSDVGLGSVENTTLSTWNGSTNITTLGTITTGTWNGNAIPMSRGGLNADISALSGILKISGGVASAIADNSTDWNTAYGWGNHTSAGYTTASSTNTFTNKSGSISQWTNDSGYLTSFSETDPIYLSSSAATITGTNIANWITAFGWGNHSSAGYMTASSVNTLTNKSGNISQWTNNSGYITATSTDTLLNKTWNSNAIGATYGGTGFTSFTAGDMLYATNATTLSKLTVGTNGQALTVVGGVPTWGTVSGTSHPLLSSAHSDALTETVTRGALISGQGASPTWSLLGPGTSGQVLKSNGAGADLGWVTLAKSDVGLGLVENTALSGWNGSTNITTLGTIGTGVWGGSAIAPNRGGTGITSYAIGDVLYASGASTLSKLTAGAVGQALIISAGGTPTWSSSVPTYPHNLLNAAEHPDTTTGAATRGDLIVGNSSNLWARMGRGASGNILSVNGSDLAWNSPAGLGLATLAGSETLTNKTIGAGSSYQGNAVVTTYGGTGLAGGYAAGDILYYSVGSSLTRLARGANGTILSLSGGFPSWIATTGITTLGTITTGTWNGTVIDLAHGGTGATDAATARTNLGLGTLAELNSADLTADVTGILPVANGGTGTNSGSVTGTGALSFTAGGASNDINLNPTGTGMVAVNAALGIKAGSYRTIFQGDPSQANDITYTLPAATGAAGEVLKVDASNNLYWAAVSGGSGGIGTVTSVGTGNGLAGGPITNTGTLSINLLSANGGAAPLSSSLSGLQFSGSSNNQLALLQGCANDNVLAWDDVLKEWKCASVSGVGALSGSGTSGQIAVWNGTSSLTTQAQLNVNQGGTGATDATTARTNLGLIINTNVQAYHANLAAIAAGTWAGATSLVTMGVITTGTWHGEIISPTYGGTGLGTYSIGDILYADGASSLATLAAGTGNAGKVLVVNGSGIPIWSGSAPTYPHKFLNALEHPDTTDADPVRGDLIVANSSAKWSSLAIGTAGNTILANNGTDVAWNSVTNLELTTWDDVQTLTNKTMGLDSDWQGDPITTTYGGTGLTTFSAGDILYYNAGVTLSRLAKGSDGNVLSLASGIPVWSSTVPGASHDILSASHSDTTAGPVVRGGLITGQGASASWSLLDPGTNGQILQSNGTDIGWVSLTSSDVGLGSVENTALSTWNGSTNITTLGTITTGTWNGTNIPMSRGGLNADISALSGILKISGGVASAIADNSTNWNTAFSWGNHSTAGYTTASSTNTFTNKSGSISQWTNDSGYLTSFSETDPIYLASSAATITPTNIANWITAFGWGNHSSAGYMTASSVNTLTNKSGSISQWTNNSGYITATSTDTLLNKTWNSNAIGATYGGTGFTSFTAGDMLYATNATTLSKLTVGTNGQALTVVGGVPTWGAVSGTSHPLLSSAHSDASTATVARGALISGQGASTTWSLLGPGTSGQVLKSNGAGADLGWVTLAKSDVGLGLVENTALSGWNGSTNITTLGTIGTGVWEGDTIGVGFGGTGTTTQFTPGSLVFAGASGVYSEDNANLFWDNTNKRLGVGTSTPTASLNINGNLSIGSSSSAVAEGFDLLVSNDGGGGYFGIGTREAGDWAGGFMDYGYENNLNAWVDLFEVGGETYDTNGGNLTRNWYVKDSMANETRLFLDASGNLGIGTTTPTSLFSVGATSQFQVNASGQVVAGTWNGTDIADGYIASASNWNTAYGWGDHATQNYFDIDTDLLGVASGGTGTTTSFDQGSLVFAGSSGVYSQNNANLYWDNASNYFRLGAGAQQYSMGVDAADSNKFKIATGNGIAGSNAFSIATNGVTSIASLNMGTQEFAQDSGIISWIDMPVTNSAANNTVESYTASLDGNAMISIYGKADGAGNVNNLGVGIGTTAPTAMLQVGTAAAGGNVRIDNGWLCVDNNGSCTGATTAGTVYAVNAYTTGADYAEYFETKDSDLKSGEAVCIDSEKDNAVKRCQNSGDNDIMGIVSTNPSIVGNRNEKQASDPSHFVIVGMMGQVAGQVSSENGRINIGDSLTSAGFPGYLRKANAGESTVGIAMQNFTDSKGKIQVLISRRNKSLTVEKVEEAVTQNIANMNIKDQVDTMVASAKTVLEQQTSLNETRFVSLETLTQKLQKQMDEIKAQTFSELNVAQIDLNKQDIIYLKMVLGITESSKPGDIAIAGKLKVTAIETGKLVVGVDDPDARTIGEDSIIAIKIDTDSDGKDDATGSDGKSYFVKTTAINVSSKVFITPKVALEQGVAVTDVKFGEGFTISVKNPVAQDVPCDWVIIEEK